MSNLIHPSAIIHPKAKLGKNIQVGPFALIDEDVLVGNNCIIHNNVSLLNGTRLGNNVTIHQSSVISGLPQVTNYEDEDKSTTVEIGDRSIIREFVTISRGTDYHKKTSVGKDCFIMAYVHLAHDVLVEDKVILANGVQIAGHVEIGYHASIGGLVPVHQFVKIGAHSFIGGGYRVPKDVPPFILAMGDPLVYGGLNRVGLHRQGFKKDVIRDIYGAYRLLYKSNFLIKEAVEAIKNSFESTTEIKIILDFIRKSTRGMISAKRR